MSKKFLPAIKVDRQEIAWLEKIYQLGRQNFFFRQKNKEKDIFPSFDSKDFSSIFNKSL